MLVTEDKSRATEKGTGTVDAPQRLIEALTWLCTISSITGQEGLICDAVSDRLRASRPDLVQRRH
ncbi:MAG: hypothetical protein MUF54_19540, partial [Polyangiaceae bacterium]|nr:hypothetical protein [Polyangiaceae bacterium]